MVVKEKADTSEGVFLSLMKSTKIKAESVEATH